MVVRQNDDVQGDAPEGQGLRHLGRGLARDHRTPAPPEGRDRRRDEAHRRRTVKENSKYASILSLAKAIEKGEADIGDVKGLKPLFRLPPPRKGYEGIKRAWNDGGALGYRGADIEKLIDRMLVKPKEAK